LRTTEDYNERQWVGGQARAKIWGYQRSKVCAAVVGHIKAGKNATNPPPPPEIHKPQMNWKQIQPSNANRQRGGEENQKGEGGGTTHPFRQLTLRTKNSIPGREQKYRFFWTLKRKRGVRAPMEIKIS